MKKFFLAGLVLTVLASYAQPRTGVSSNQNLIKDLAYSIKVNYVLEEEALKMHDLLLKNLRKGNYDRLQGMDLADQLQADLRSVFNDKHLRIRYGTGGGSIGARRAIPHYEFNIGAAEILDQNIGYLEITGFRGVTRALKKHVATQISRLKNTNAIIIDLRNNGGGNPESIQLICSYFFSPEPSLLLNSLYFRNKDFKRDFYVLTDLDGERITQTPIYILTSNYTFSGGEEFAYNMQSRKRAILIGEVTGGGAHPVDAFRLRDGFTALIPVGKAINPVTGTNWEGTGVKPDIKIDERKALEKALELISQNKGG